jgi:hypothetical protein
LPQKTSPSRVQPLGPTTRTDAPRAISTGGQIHVGISLLGARA